MRAISHLAIHNHGGDRSVGFSDVDLQSHERGYPALLDIAGGTPVGALVLAHRAVAGDIWLPGGGRVVLADTHVIGRRRTVLTPAPTQTRAAYDPTYDRQSRMFGDAGQDILRHAKVAIIGLGGVGSLLAEYLARLGVGYLLLIDPDRIDRSNLPRVVNATRWDARYWLTGDSTPAWLRALARRTATPKVKIARRVIRRANPDATVVVVHDDVLEPVAATKLLDCDYIFLAADMMQARLLFNAVAHQYLIPGVQVGSKVTTEAESGAVTNVHTVIRPVTPESGCLWCNGIINRARLQEEGQTEPERAAQRYVDDPEVVAPSVITLNAVGAAHAANDFLFYMTGLADPAARQSYLRFKPTRRDFVFDNPKPSAECSECGADSDSRFARGDLGPGLPTYWRG